MRRCYNRIRLLRNVVVESPNPRATRRWVRNLRQFKAFRLELRQFRHDACSFMGLLLFIVGHTLAVSNRLILLVFCNSDYCLSSERSFWWSVGRFGPWVLTGRELWVLV